jgi:hypothetical protein
MALRESGRAVKRDFNIDALVDPNLDIGVDGGRALLDFAEAILETDVAELNRARAALADELGPAAVGAAAIIAGNFTKNDRIANGVGIPADPMFLQASEDFRERLGLMKFRSAKNTFG